MSKISISVPDEALLKWAKTRAARDGRGLSAVFVEALRTEREMQAGRDLLALWPERPPLTDEAKAAIDAEWMGGPRYEPPKAPVEPKKRSPSKKSDRKARSKKRRAA
jgi:hypothetical protein